MKEANSSKCMYMRSTADISLKWNDIRNAHMTQNWDYMRSIADIPKLSEIARSLCWKKDFKVLRLYLYNKEG